MNKLPIFGIKERFIDAIRTGNRIIISAPTGSGKSTQIPQFLFDFCDLHRKILVLQPRRIAARMLSARVARERNENLGSLIGFQTRFESCFSEESRILFITEGILPRLLISNPHLDDIEAIILDEFHERSINNDIGLGLIKNLQDHSRSDLKLIVMSATLDADHLVPFLNNSVHISCSSRNHPIDLNYLPPQPQKPVWDLAATALKGLIASGADGDVLIFMPGAYEIHRTIECCRQIKTGERLAIKPLYGDLPTDQQDDVMTATKGNLRKVIVATNIAETSLTVEGVRHVIDSGLVRVNRFDPVRGLNTLFVEPVARASADQRAGRAGREAPGKCIRLWTSREQEGKKNRNDPEVKRIDLAETILQLKSLGCERIDDFPWLEPPSKKSVDSAVSLLSNLGALHKRDQSLTDLGRQLAKFPAHPRIARMLVEADRCGCLETVSTIAAVMSERSIIRSGKQAVRGFRNGFDDLLVTNHEEGTDRKSSRNRGERDKTSDAVRSDLFALINALHFAREVRFDPSLCEAKGVHGSAARQVWRTSDYYINLCRRYGMRCGHDSLDPEDVIKSILLGFPDHLARRRDLASLPCQLQDGRKGELDRTSAIRDCEVLVAAEIREIGTHGKGPKIMLSLVSEVKVEWLIDMFPDDWRFEKSTVWNDTKQVVEKRTTDRCLNLIIQEQISNEVDLDLAGQILARAVGENKLVLTGWNKDAKNWIRKARNVACWFPSRSLCSFDDNDITEIVKEICRGERRYSDVRNKPCLPYIKSLLSYEDQQFVESMAPDHLTLPTGRKLRIKYRSEQPPKGSAKIQDLYGLQETPLIANGLQAVVIEILAPNMRAIQVTDDLAGFWRTLYPEVKKDLSRRYPKHEWR